MYTAGIDLGTSQSCICIPARPGKTGDGPVEVVLDELGKKITPSVVTEDSTGKVIVGDLAKKRAGLKPKPIFFIKRYMGTDHKEVLCGREMTAEEISAEILKHLKTIANNYLGALVSRAVICVPAYFDLNQKEATKRAGKLAGLEVVDVLPEPIAAALSYGLQDDRANLNIFCYDLGGGTFDATVMQKKDGDIKVLSFGGDPYLGGSDFDTLLANHILERLIAPGKYKLDLDFSNDADDARYQVLLQRAEKYKFELTNDQQVPIWEGEIFEDQNGRIVDIDMALTRKEFEELIYGEEYPEFEEFCNDYLHEGKRPIEVASQAMISEGIGEQEITERRAEEYIAGWEQEIQNRPASVKKSIYLSILALMKSGLFLEEIDEVIMVGGSSYVPLVRSELEKLFGKKAKLEDPNVIVAKGAALKAGQSDNGYPPGLELDRFDKATFLTDVNISGRLDAGIIGCSIEEVSVRLIRADQGYDAKAKPHPGTGAFKFEDVGLLEGSENHFQLSVLDDSRAVLLSHDFSILHDDEAEGDEGVHIDPLITKPIYIETVAGLELVFKEGDKIPNHRRITDKKTQDQTGMIVIPIYEGDRLRGEIVVDGLNRKLPVGTPVEISIEVTRDLDLHGSASVPSDDNKSGSVHIQIEQMKLKDIKEMRAEFEGLKDDFDEVFVRADKGKRLKYSKKGKRLIEDTENEFQTKPPVRPKIAAMMLSLKTIIARLRKKDIFTPSMEEFEKNLKKAQKLDEEGEYSRELDNIGKAGKEAYEKKNLHEWKMHNENLEKTNQDLIEKKVEDIPIEVRAQLTQESVLEQVRVLSNEAQKLGVGDRYADDLRGLTNKIMEVDVVSDPVSAIKRLREIYVKDYLPLESEITHNHKVCRCGAVYGKEAFRCPNCGAVDPGVLVQN
jgi:molecular chaperone DnaK (HSP70)